LRLERGGEQRIRERLRRSSWRLETRERRRAQTRVKVSGYTLLASELASLCFVAVNIV